ncbi:KPN_02809 family neutral zinc metallopeptidase [Rhizosaccharibacter radicis]|uniref:Neutral zinc metallopeptidase n=1 Tax=Rhizosaccharibacter radicis TaxID=2782605 RepID=A0ABT1VZ42_9PROT|nr:neutral zinc metallopeptidase [Acetobacteraceae bacterium KSS12]
MRLDDERESSNVDDERGATGSGGGGIGGGGGFGGRGVRIGGIGTVVVVLGALYFGIDPRLVLSILNGGGPAQTQSAGPSSAPPDTGDGRGQTAPTRTAAAGDDDQKRFVSRVLASTEDVWGNQFRQLGKSYQQPTLVLFTGGIRSGCGFAQTAVGPFYCPADHKVYLDLGFFRELQDKLGAGGDFARAYVVAHEVGHHVQSQLGIMDQVDQARAQMSDSGRNALSVKVELQADCFAGVWAKQADEAKHILQTGDVEQGLNAAAAVGDDRLQRETRGTVEPDSFTHGSSAQRVRWFRRGLDSGDLHQCDTFKAEQL